MALNAACRTFWYSQNAKSKKGLQRTLDAYWVVHNFMRSHFTTNKVPAVALGILDKALS